MAPFILKYSRSTFDFEEQNHIATLNERRARLQSDWDHDNISKKNIEELNALVWVLNLIGEISEED